MQTKIQAIKTLLNGFDYTCLVEEVFQKELEMFYNDLHNPIYCKEGLGEKERNTLKKAVLSLYEHYFGTNRTAILKGAYK